MIRLRVFVIVATMGALLLGISACNTALFTGKAGDECVVDDSCYSELHCCYDAICHECCEDEDCGPRGKCDEFECVRCDTDHDCLEGLHCCDDANCEECCYDMHCDQGENCEDYKCVPVEEPSEPELVGQVPAPEPEEEAQPAPAPEIESECTVDEDCADGLLCVDGQCTEPLPDAELVLPFILGEFQEEYNHCFDSRDPVALAKIFHNTVNELYSPDQCQAYADSVIGTHINIKITGWTGPGPFSWMIDGRSILIDDAYTVQVDFTRDTTITSQLEFHPAVRADGSLGLLTDCGDPLPLPVEEEQQTPEWVRLAGTVPQDLGPEGFVVVWPEVHAIFNGMPTIGDCGFCPDGTLTHLRGRAQGWASGPVDEQGNFVIEFPYTGPVTGWVLGGFTLWEANHVKGFIGAPFQIDDNFYLGDVPGQLRLGPVYECPPH